MIPHLCYAAAEYGADEIVMAASLRAEAEGLREALTDDGLAVALTFTPGGPHPADPRVVELRRAGAVVGRSRV